jgi:hypothetical protein
MKQAEQVLRELYLDYVNNYLTPTCFAEHNGLDIDQAREILKIGRSLHEKNVAMMRRDAA